MAARSTRPCSHPGCPALVRSGARCPTHQRARQAQVDEQRGTRTERGYGNDWLRLSQAAIAAQPWCSRCGTTTDLTTDHPTALARGGERLPIDLVVLCRSCNSAKGAN